MDAQINFGSNNYLLYFLFYMGLAAIGVYLIVNAIMSGRPFQQTVTGGFIWVFQLVFGVSLTFFPFYHLLTPYILK